VIVAGRLVVLQIAAEQDFRGEQIPCAAADPIWLAMTAPFAILSKTESSFIYEPCDCDATGHPLPVSVIQ
jgi:hypothetical protein